jgi:RNA polymerase sigma factor (sigma-70 family)
MARARNGDALRQIHRLFGEGTLAGLPDGRLLERYVAHRDELAFQALVQRHGPMVMAVCRGVLNDPNDADDAFQAAFLLLARKVRSIWIDGSIGGWLHRVAWRIAFQVKTDVARRRRLEQKAAELAGARERFSPPWDDAGAVLHQEIDRLPERYRKPIVLCYLEDMTYQQAANSLQWSEGTTRGRLARGKQLLRDRLTRRGVAFTAAAIGAGSAAPTVSAVSMPLLRATTRAAGHIALGESAAAGTVSTTTVALMKQAMRSMMIARLKIAAAAALIVGALTGLATGLAAMGPTGPAAPISAPPRIGAHDPAPEPVKATSKAETLAYRGRVLGPSGQPVAGAKLYLTPMLGYLHQPYPSSEATTTGPDGRFAFTVPEAKYRNQGTTVTATAPNHGAGWVIVPTDGKRDDLTIPLVNDDVPITGQIIDLEGRPVPGATLRLMQINAAPGEDLGPWIEAVKGRKGDRFQLAHQHLPRYTIAPAPTVTTDAEGRFRLIGIGPNRLVAALLDGPTIASQYLHILTRPGKTLELPEDRGGRGLGDPRIVTNYYGANFQHAAAPTKPIVGVVRDKDTKRPLAGVTIRSHILATSAYMTEIVRTTTDRDGRFRLTGMPKGQGNKILAIPAADQPYPIIVQDAPDTPGLDPVTVDFDLRRGIWIEGRVTDKLTGQPVQTQVEYFSLYGNPNLSDYPGFIATIPFNFIPTKDDGTYRIVGLPGSGLVGVYHEDGYLVAPKRDDEYGTKEPSLNTAPWAITNPVNYAALARIDPPKGVDAVTQDVTLVPAYRIRGTVLGPDGKPAAGASVFLVGVGSIPERAEPILKAKANDKGTFHVTLSKAEFDDAIDRSQWATVTVLATAEGLGPDWVELRRPPGDGLVLQLVDDSVPITGRILDLQGRPIAGAKIALGQISAEGADGIDPYLKLVRDDPIRASGHQFAKNCWIRLPGQPASVMTDDAGRFRLTGIGRDRIVEIAVVGPTIQSATITAMTRNAATVSSPPVAVAATTIYGATFDHLVPPGRAITGVVRDKRTGKPLAGVEVCGDGTNARVTTDADGRYTLPGFPKGKSYPLSVLAGWKSPYFVTCAKVPDSAGMAPIRFDVECVPGIPFRLKLIDGATGKPVKGAEVSYGPIYPNAHAREVPGFAPLNAIGPYNTGIPQADGTYLLGVLPGPGGVFVRTAEGLYPPACVDSKAFFNPGKDKQPGKRSPRVYGDKNTIFIASGEGFNDSPQSQYSAIVLINPPDDSGPMTAEAVLRRDQKREVRVLSPEGAPLAGVTAEGEGAEATTTPGVMTIGGLLPQRPKRFIFHHDARKLVGSLIARGDEAAPYTVKLQPWGTIAGRLVDAQGKPRPRVHLMTSDWQKALIDPARGVIFSGQKTDDEGRFRYDRLVPGQAYSANAVGEEAAKGGFGVVIDRIVLKPGETRDLGDVQSREITWGN